MKNKYKLSLIFIFTLVSLLTFHLNASVTQAVCIPGTNINILWTPSQRGCANAAPVAPPVVTPATQKPDDFSLISLDPKCDTSGSKVLLNWSRADKAESYKIHRVKKSDGADIKSSIPIFTQDASQTSYKDTTEGDTSYEYIIEAVNSVGLRFSDFSDPKEIHTQKCDPKEELAKSAQQDRQNKLAKINEACTYLGQTDQTCIQQATDQCLDSGAYKDPDQWECIGGFFPNLPGEFTLKLPTLACDANGNGITLSLSNDSYGAVSYKIYRKVNDGSYQLYDQTRAIVWTDRNIPNNLLTASYRIEAINKDGLIRSSNEISFPPAGSDADTLLSQLFNCRKGGPGLRTDPPKLDPSTTPVASFIRDLTIQRVGSGDEKDPYAGFGENADTFAPNELARFGARLFNSNLKDNNGCPVVGVNFRFLRVNDDGTTSEIGSHINKPVCQPHPFKLAINPGNYIFQVEFAGEEGLGAAAGPQRLPFRVTKEEAVPTSMFVYINGRSDTSIIFMDSPEFAGTVNIGAKVFVKNKDEDCIIKPINLKFERVADQNFKPLPGGPESIFSTTVNDPAANCQAYQVPAKGSLTEPGVYKLTGSFIQGAKDTALKPVLESSTSILLKRSGFDQATIDASIGGEPISKAKSKGAVAGITAQKIGDQIVLKNDPTIPTSTIPVRACVRPKNNPQNIQAVSGVRIMVEKFDLAGNPLGLAFNEGFSNDCQPREIDLGSPEGIGCYNFNFLEEDEDYVAKPISKRLCFTQTPAANKPFTNITIDPVPGTISSVDDPIVTVITNQFSNAAHFAVLNDGRPYPVSPSSSVPVSDACQTGNGDCVYRLQISKPDGTFEVKFCYDNQNNCTESVVFSTTTTPYATDPDQIISVGLIVDGTEISLPFDGTSRRVNLAPLSKKEQVFRLAIHRADKSRDSYPSLTFIYDEELGATDGGTEQPPVPPAAPTETTPQVQACTPGEFKRQCTGLCGGCAAIAGEAKISQCRADGSGFYEQGGECSTDCAGPCQAVPTGQCDGDYAYWDENANTCIYKRVTNPYPCEYDFVPTEAANCGL